MPKGAGEREVVRGPSPLQRARIQSEEKSVLESGPAYRCSYFLLVQAGHRATNEDVLLQPPEQVGGVLPAFLYDRVDGFENAAMFARGEGAIQRLERLL